MRPFRLIIVAALIVVALPACKQQPAPRSGVTSRLSGTIAYDPRYQYAGDLSGFHVAVYHQVNDRLDTLGAANTNRQGQFSMDITAPDRGVYALVIMRGDSVFKSDELAVADGDTAVVKAVVPRKAPLIIRSRENAAWTAYKNTRARYNETLFQASQAKEQDREALALQVLQTANILWNMRDTYPGTVGADLAAANSVAMLGGVDDVLLLQRARSVPGDNPGFVEVAKAARQAEIRLRGTAAGVDLVREFIQKAESTEDKALLNAELVIAYGDNNRQDQARIAAAELVKNFPGTDAAFWAEHALYDFQHLDAAMDAPPFRVMAVNGRQLSLDSFKGGLLLLEFYQPGDRVFQQELGARNQMVTALRGMPFNILSISVDPDTTRNKQFLSSVAMPGTHVVLGPLPAGVSNIADSYNVYSTPRRVLIDSEGRIISKHDGASIAILQQEIATLFRDAAGRR